MKNSCPSTVSIIRSFGLAALVALASALPAGASAELDRSFALESVGILRSWDNVDGLFSDYVGTAYRDWFSRQSRFVLQDIGKADTVLGRSKIPYQKLIHDPKVLEQVARATRSESLIRTTIFKEGSQYRFNLEWLHSPRMEKMASDSFVIKEINPGEVQIDLQKALERLISKAPFVANVTGRDADSVTVNIGLNAKLFRGDVLVVATIDEVKRHPLLKEVVDWRLTPIGKVEVESVDEKMAFCRVIEEEEGHKIARYQKITQIIPKQVPIQKAEEDKTPIEQVPPRLGWVSGGLGLGSFSRDMHVGTPGFNGSGIYLGPKAEGQLWLNKEWFTEMALDYGLWSYSQDDSVTGASSPAGSVSAHQSTFRFDLGYTYFLTSDFFGPKGFVRFGYQSMSFSFPVSSTELTAPVSFKGLFLGLGGELPVRGNWGALLNLNFGLFPSASATGDTSVDANSASFMSFAVGASYRSTLRLAFRATIEVLAQSADFPGNAILSQKVVAITPSVLYYF